MNLRAMTPARSESKSLIAHVAPFALFMLGLALVQGVSKFAAPGSPLWLTHPEYWVYPLQTLVCALALVVFWKNYDFGAGPGWMAPGLGLIVFALWVSPQGIFHQAPRLDGFDPTVFEGDPALYWCTVIARFLRLVVVVPLLEEIFWRGFLQRYLIDENFTRVPFGKYTPLSFWGVAVGFTLIHSMPDWPAAFVTGAIYGWVAVRTKSLCACVVAHAVTNLALGGYIMATRQWGFW